VRRVRKTLLVGKNSKDLMEGMRTNQRKLGTGRKKEYITAILKSQRR
jgi:hypothetical protein